MRKIILILTTALVLLLLAANPLAPTTPVIDWWAIGPSSTEISSGAIELQSTIGQGVIGHVNQADEDICSGYLCILAKIMTFIHLPLIMK